MRVLLDTHIVVWLLEGHHRLKPFHYEILESLEHKIFYSPMNLFELALIKSKQKLSHLPTVLNIENYLNKIGFENLPIHNKIFGLLESLPPYHKDPHDRLLICQAIAERCKIMTADTAFKQYSADIIDV